MTAARKNPAKSGPPRRRTRAGLSKAAIYLYFLGNTALFKGVVQHAPAISAKSHPSSRCCWSCRWSPSADTRWRWI